MTNSDSSAEKNDDNDNFNNLVNNCCWPQFAFWVAELSRFALCPPQRLPTQPMCALTVSKTLCEYIPSLVLFNARRAQRKPLRKHRQNQKAAKKHKQNNNKKTNKAEWTLQWTCEFAVPGW